jgi:hypothetical protein
MGCRSASACAQPRSTGALQPPFWRQWPPAEIDAWARARKAQRQSDEALRRAEAQQVDRLRYEARLAERQFNRVDPDNRLVAAELERRWEAALVELPELWADPSVSGQHRKALLCCLIEKVVMRRAARDKADVRIVWRGGEITEMTVMLPVNAISALPRHAEMEAQVLELARAGVDDAEIARQLTAEGHRSPSSAEVLPTTIQGIRLRHRL